jgi:hypothetical protein
MSKEFRPWKIDEAQLLPPRVQDYVPPDHLSRLVVTFGQIKQARGCRQFLLRGIGKVKAEWALIRTAHNLTKLARAA